MRASHRPQIRNMTAQDGDPTGGRLESARQEQLQRDDREEQDRRGRVARREADEQGRRERNVSPERFTDT
jgi:hypothetical protein